MPLVTAPNLIEAPDFSGGWMPDLEISNVPANGLLGVMNLLPDHGSGAAQLRKGYKRVGAALTQGYTLGSIHVYNRPDGGNFLILVEGNGIDGEADNCKIWALDLRSGSTTYVGSRTFTRGDPMHGGAVVDNKFYGFPPDDTMYAWSPEGGFEAAPAQPNFPHYNTIGTFGDSSRPSDFAFKKGDQVIHSDETFGDRAFSAKRGIRAKRVWKSGARYRRKQKVTLKPRKQNGVQHDWPETSSAYWRTYRCRRSHTASQARRPGDGTGKWERYWRLEELGDPANEEGEVGQDWIEIPTAPNSDIGTWFANRMWMLYDDDDVRTGLTRIVYSASAAPKEGQTKPIAWNPKDWRLSTEEPIKGFLKKSEALSGGHMSFAGDEGDRVTGVIPLATMLLVLKRKSTWVLGGRSEASWTVRPIAKTGAVSKRAWCHHEGTIYFLSDEGLFQTNGQEVQPVQGIELVQDWLRSALNWEEAGAGVTMFSFAGFVWISLPTLTDRAPTRTLVYEPKSGSWWMTDLAVQAAAVNYGQTTGGTDQLYFAGPSETGALVGAVYGWDGTPYESSSSRTAVSPAKNLFRNPSFEKGIIPVVNSPGVGADANSWFKTHSERVECRVSTVAAFRGRLGIVVANKSPDDSTRRGIQEYFADEDGTTHTISVYVRRQQWKKTREIEAGDVKFYIGNSGFNHDTKRYIGQGWYRLSFSYAGSADARNHGVVVRNERTFHLDGFMVNKGGLLDYFDGDGGASKQGIEGGDTPLLFQYDHPDVRDNVGDDTGQPSYVSKPVRWSLRTAWFPFGVLREDRRIRRTWVMVRSVTNAVLRLFRNYDDSAAGERTASIPGTGHLEGVHIPDSFSVALSVEGLASKPMAILGAAVDTQPRRVRYHSPTPS